MKKLMCLGLLATVFALMNSDLAHAQSAGYTDNGYYGGNYGRSTMLPQSNSRQIGLGASLSANLGLWKKSDAACCGNTDTPPAPPIEEQPNAKAGGCGGKGKWCLVPETHVVRRPAMTCVEKAVCAPQICLGPCGIGIQMIHGTVKVPAITCVEKEVTRYRWVHEPCTCGKHL